jgi:hypothetical protein
MLLLSSHSLVKRGFVQKEVRQALDLLDEVPDSQIFLIPLRLEYCTPEHDRLRALQWVDLLQMWEAGVDRLRAVFSFVPPETHQAAASDRFRRGWRLEALDSELWSELAAVLALGGTLESDSTFVAPYVFSRWPASYDAFDYLAVIASNVRVRAEPSSTAPILRRVSFEVVQRGPKNPQAPDTCRARGLGAHPVWARKLATWPANFSGVRSATARCLSAVAPVDYDDSYRRRLNRRRRASVHLDRRALGYALGLEAVLAGVARSGGPTARWGPGPGRCSCRASSSCSS